METSKKEKAVTVHEVLKKRAAEEREEFEKKWGLFRNCQDFCYRLYYTYTKYAPLSKDELMEGDKWEDLEMDPEGLCFYLSRKGIIPYRVDIVLELLQRLSGLDDNGLLELLLNRGEFELPSYRDRYVELIINVRSSYRDLLRQKKVNATYKWGESDLEMLNEDAFCELLKLNKKTGFFLPVCRAELNKINEILSEIIRNEAKDKVLFEFWNDNRGYDPFR